MTHINRKRLAIWLLLLGACLLALQFLLVMKHDTMNVRLLFSGGVVSGNYLRTKFNDVIVAMDMADTQQDSGLANQSRTTSTVHGTEEKSSLHEGHNGFELAMKVQGMCNNTVDRRGARSNKFLAAPRQRLIYCPVEKVGTTFWRRALYMLTGPNTRAYTNPYDVPINTALDEAHYYAYRAGVQTNRGKSLLDDNSFKFFFVRNPYSRLLSVYIDKLVPPNPIYWKAFGVKAISAFRKGASPKSLTHGYDVTFSEFVKHVIVSERTHRNLDGHFLSASESCTPCKNKFDYIGKMETFRDDSFFIFKKVGMNSTIYTLTKQLSNLTTDDAITDSIRSPFYWKTNVVKVITWDTALRRVWLKLQMRGIIGLEQTFPLTNAQTNITVNAFINLARDAHKRSVPSQLKKQKSQAMKEAFDSLTLDDLNAFIEIFKKDFQYYGYEERPSSLFADRPKEATEPKVFKYDKM